jgi:hypothetical protein
LEGVSAGGGISPELVPAQPTSPMTTRPRRKIRKNFAKQFIEKLKEKIGPVTSGPPDRKIF